MLTLTRRLVILRRRIVAAAVVAVAAGLVTLWAGRAVGLEVSAEIALLGKLGGTAAAAVAFWAALLRLLSPGRFYEMFINDRYYLGADGGSVMKPATFRRWLAEGGDLVFNGEIYYNSTKIREAAPERRREAKPAEPWKRETDRGGEGGGAVFSCEF